MLANLLNRRAGCVNRARPDLWGVWGASPIFTRWVDISVWGDYYIKKLGIKENMMSVFNYSHSHPRELTINDYNVDVIQCGFKDLAKLQKIMIKINEHIRTIRGDKQFFTTVLRNFSTKFQTNYIPPENFYYFKGSFDANLGLQNGKLDLK